MKIVIKDTYAFILIGTGLAFIIVTSILFFWNEGQGINLSLPINDSKFSSYGTIMSGVVGTLWSLAGVVLFYVALTEQREDIKTNRESFNLQTEALTLQIKEFEAQTRELEATRQVYNEQLLSQNSQRFENTFFQLITLHHSIVSSYDIRKINKATEVIATGRDCFKILTQRFNWYFDNPGKADVEHDQEAIFMKIYEDQQADLSHYFRNIYHIYKFVSKSAIVDKKTYTSLVRAQLSAYELVMLFYNCLSENGFAKFKPLVEQYSIFKNLDVTIIRGGKDYVKKYKPGAYGQKDFKYLNNMTDWE